MAKKRSPNKAMTRNRTPKKTKPSLNGTMRSRQAKEFTQIVAGKGNELLGLK